MANQPRPDWVAVSSSNVKAIRFIGTDWLDVEFLRGKPGQRIYRYFGVPVQVYYDMLAAGSKGQFVHQQLKGKYSFSPIA